jgi:hypothetical protein
MACPLGRGEVGGGHDEAESWVDLVECKRGVLGGELERVVSGGQGEVAFEE